MLTGNNLDVVLEVSDGMWTYRKNVTLNEGNSAPYDILTSTTLYTPLLPLGASVSTLSTLDLNTADSHVYTIVGGLDAAKFAVANGNQLVCNVTTGLLGNNLVVIVRTTDRSGAYFDKALVFCEGMRRVAFRCNFISIY